ncbi:MAG: class I SAM-dependent methyltransferase [Actinobacteria bacterium]|nr:MAG: class I SAM-dependent methyltransferase [Actinomycetota bacterium]
MPKLPRFLRPATESAPPSEPAPEPEGLNTKYFGLLDAQLSGWFLSDTDELYRGMPISADDVVVDVGCGEGGNLSFCAQRGAHVIGIDLDEESVNTARERIADTPARVQEFHVAPAEHLPVAEGAATRVMCTEVIEHVDDPSVVLTELVRIGAPGAIYLITVPDALQERMQKEVANPEYFEFPNHIRIVERDEFARLVSDAGLEVLSQAGYGFYWSIWWAMYWASQDDESVQRPWLSEMSDPHPALQAWTEAWNELLKTPKGREIKAGLDRFMPKSQVIIARKPG